MKILLTVPMERPSDVEFSFNDNGLGYIDAALKSIGANVKLLSWNLNLSYDSYRNELLSYRPDIVGIKVFTLYYNQVSRMLEIVKENLPQTITIIGGPHPSTSEPVDLFREFGSNLDYAIAGDGELGAIELVKYLSKNGESDDKPNITDIPGLIYKDTSEVKKNKPNLEVDLNKLPQIDWSIQDPSNFQHSLAADKNENRLEKGYSALISDSRGCPASCEHCLAWIINGRSKRKLDLNILCDQIELLFKHYNVKYIEFTGNLFLSDIDYIQKLCDWLIENDIRIEWGCTGAAYLSKIKNPDILNLMRKAGCVRIHFGIESGSPDVLKRIRKPYSLLRYTEIASMTIDAGIDAIGYFMFGFPHETIKEINKTIKYALKTPFSEITFETCMPFPGTSSYKVLLEKHNINKLDWSNYNFDYPKLLPSNVNYLIIKLKLIQMKILKKSTLLKRLYKYFII